MVPPPEDLSRLQAMRWRRAIETVKELSEQGVLVSASIAAQDRSGCVWEARMQRERGTYVWSGPEEADLSQNTDWFSFWLELTVTEIEWSYLSTLVDVQYPDAEIHVPQVSVEEGVCRAS
jgi:hypothetical protein